MKRDRIATDKEIEASLKNDLLERNTYLSNLMQMLITISEHTVIALDGDWGSGKTFFIKQFEYISKNPTNYTNIDENAIGFFNSSYDIFYFNAWENDHLPPLESILMQMSKKLWSGAEEFSNKLIGLTKGLIDVPIRYLSGGSIGFADFKNTYIKQYTEHAENISNSSKEINNILHNYNSKTNKKILFIIDDLDRCKPTFAVELLETIKHNFNSDNAVFLVCANNSQLQHTIRKYYGENFRGYEYLDRFYDLIINLPEPDIEKYIKYQLKLANPDYGYNSVAISIAKAEHMSLRQVNRYISSIKLLEDFFESRNLNHEGRYGICTKNVFIPIACALKLLDTNKFKDFIAGNGDYILNEYIKKSEEIRSFRDSEPPMNTCYSKLFSQNSSHYASQNAFRKAISAIGFSTIIDAEYNSLVKQDS